MSTLAGPVPHTGTGRPPRLDDATFFDRPLQIRVYPACKELVAFAARPTRRKDITTDPPPPDVERSRRSADARARTMVRRLATEHRLTRLITLTFGRETSQSERAWVVTQLGRFTRKLRRLCGTVKWLAVLEEHPGGHGWHVHIGSDRFIAKSMIAEAWGHGFVDVRLIRPKRKGSQSQAASAAARYLAKYIEKSSMQTYREPGEHRYYRRQNMDVTVLEAEAEAGDVVELARSILGAESRWWWYASWLDEEGMIPIPILVIRSG